MSQLNDAPVVEAQQAEEQEVERSILKAGGIRYVEDFDPRRFVTRVGGADYLEVKWRLYWLRAYDPDACIKTELYWHENNIAIFKAEVMLSGHGNASATGWGSEGYDDFRDYLEKAETKALGRALSALGFGTQFTPDFDFEQGTGKVVDAPVRQARPQQTIRPENAQGGSQQYQRSGESQMTDRQMGFIRGIARDKGLTDDALDTQVRELFGKEFTQLDRRDASSYIERLKAMPSAEKAPSR